MKNALIVNKKSKIIVLCGIVIIFIACILAVVLNTGIIGGTSDKRLPDLYDGTVEKYVSSVDKDNDGIDDQTDILKGALDYIKTKPQYKSKYYNGGYPDDGYGVCTDVVADALKEAGYDLVNEVNEDIKENSQNYDIEEPDENIDFRRVKNLKVYFAQNAISLTTDVKDFEEWQGGDIVIFKSHIGIVSDRRNKNGVPYVIHHNGRSQKSYEEDILEKRSDIVGHYRIS